MMGIDFIVNLLYNYEKNLWQEDGESAVTSNMVGGNYAAIDKKILSHF